MPHFSRNGFDPVGRDNPIAVGPIRRDLLIPGPKATHTTPLQRIWSAVYRQRYPLILSLVAALALGALAIELLPKKYTASSSVQIEQQVPQVIAVSDLDPEPEDANRFLQTQLDRLRSRTLAIDVARSSNISTSPQIRSALGINDNTVNNIVHALQENVAAELGLDTRLARISFTSGDPVVSAILANAYARALVADNLHGKVETTTRAQKYLLDRLDETKRKLETSERGLLAYARQADLTGTILPEAVAQGSEPAQQVVHLANLLAAATARRIDAEQEWRQVKGTSAPALSQVQDNRAYQQLLAEKAQLQAELAQDRGRHTDEYPTVAAKLSQVREMNSEIGALAGNIQQAIFQRYSAAARQEAQLKATIDRLRGSAMAEQERSVGYNSMARDVETNRVAYDGLLQRYKEVSAAAGAPAANISLVDLAEPPLDPASPKPLWIMSFAGLFGLITGMSIALFREQLHSVLRTAEDLENCGRISVLGVIPVLGRREKMMQALRNRHSAQSEAYSSLATAVQQAQPVDLPQTMLLTSTQANEGKSTSSFGLALGLRTLGYRVLVVNGDLRNPSGDQGFSEMLEGTLDPQDLAYLQGSKGFAFIDTGMVKANPVSLLSPARVRSVLSKLGVFADIILVDGPPILGLADAVLLADSVETILMVVEANRTTTGELDAALSRLPAKVPIAGLLTKFDARKAGVNYGGHDYYSYGGTVDRTLPA